MTWYFYMPNHYYVSNVHNLCPKSKNIQQFLANKVMSSYQLDSFDFRPFRHHQSQITVDIRMFSCVFPEGFEKRKLFCPRFKCRKGRRSSAQVRGHRSLQVPIQSITCYYFLHNCTKYSWSRFINLLFTPVPIFKAFFLS